MDYLIEIDQFNPKYIENRSKMMTYIENGQFISKTMTYIDNYNHNRPIVDFIFIFIFN